MLLFVQGVLSTLSLTPEVRLVLLKMLLFTYPLVTGTLTPSDTMQSCIKCMPGAHLKSAASERRGECLLTIRYKALSAAVPAFSLSLWLRPTASSDYLCLLTDTKIRQQLDRLSDLWATDRPVHKLKMDSSAAMALFRTTDWLRALITYLNSLIPHYPSWAIRHPCSEWLDSSSVIYHINFLTASPSVTIHTVNVGV